MTFYYPIGLLGLIGIPIIILIYIIKSKYTEQTIASTYLWTLSERFLKKRKPISKLTGILNLILQLLAVVIISVAIAHPVFVVKDSANDVYIILDGSASMNMQQNDQTRFDIAKQRVNELIDAQGNGSTYSLVFVGDTVDTVFEGVTGKAQAKIFVDNLNATWAASDCSAAVALAQTYFDSNRSAVMYLVTDKQYEVNDNLTLIDVSDNESNCAFYSYGYDTDTGGIRGIGQVISYNLDKQLTVEMWIAQSVADAPVKVAETTVEVVAGEPAEFALSGAYSRFAKLELRLTDDDALAQDNRIILYDDDAVQERKVLLVSNINDEGDDAVYLRNAIRYAGKADVDVITPETYEKQGAVNYDMYVFNGYVPAVLPKQAAIWLVDAIDGKDLSAGVSYRGHTTPRDAEGPSSYYTPQYTKETGAIASMLTKDVVGRQVSVRTYAQYIVPPRNFTSVLSVNGDNLVFAGLNGNNDREVVFSFRIKDSNLGLTDDFLILVRNLMEYSFPSVLNETVYVCGDTVNVNVVSGCESIVVTSPSGVSSTLDTVDVDVCEFIARETGTYTVTVKLNGREATDMYAYAVVPQSESGNAQGGSLMLAGEREYGHIDGFYDDLIIFFIAMAILVLADWGVYCYEQYQLR